MSIVTTFWRDSGLPPALLYCVLLLVVTVAANLIVHGLHAVLVHLFPIPHTLDELTEDRALQKNYRQDLKRIGVIEAVLTRVGLVLGPFAFWYAAQFFIKLVSAD